MKFTISNNRVPAAVFGAYAVFTAALGFLGVIAGTIIWHYTDVPLWICVIGCQLVWEAVGYTRR